MQLKRWMYMTGIDRRNQFFLIVGCTARRKVKEIKNFLHCNIDKNILVIVGTGQERNRLKREMGADTDFREQGTNFHINKRKIVILTKLEIERTPQRLSTDEPLLRKLLGID